MSIPRQIRKHFEGFPFGAACTPADIAKAEKQLGHPLPPPLAELYLNFNGFAGPTNAAFFYPLLKPSSFATTSLVEYTLFLRSEDYFPEFLWRAVAIGDYGTGPCWVILIDAPGKILEWDGEWGDDYEMLEGTLVDVWKGKKELYEKIIKEHA